MLLWRRFQRLTEYILHHLVHPLVEEDHSTDLLVEDLVVAVDTDKRANIIATTMMIVFFENSNFFIFFLPLHIYKKTYYIYDFHICNKSYYISKYNQK